MHHSNDTLEIILACIALVSLLVYTVWAAKTGKPI